MQDDEPKTRFSTNSLSLLVALLVLGIGIVFYICFRQYQLPHFLAIVAKAIPLPQPMINTFIPDGLMNSIPSYLHALASVLVFRTVWANTQYSSRLGNITILVLLFSFELLIGQVDLFDIIAIILGFMSAGYLLRQRQPSAQKSGKYPLLPVLLVAVVSTGLATGSYYGTSTYTECARYEEGFCAEYKQAASPIYMDYDTLRNAVMFEAARPPDNLGRIYLYGTYLLLNEINQGLHVFDNQNPEAPVNLGFIRIPGNREIEIRSNYLYADSYIDLITIDFSDPANLSVINRQQDIFPYDAFQNIPGNISFSRYTIERTNGVVVGYRLVGG